MEVVKLQILDGFLLPSLSLSEMRHLMLWIFLPLSRLLTAAAKFPASSFLLHDDNGLTDDLKIGPYQELLEQRSESERAADMRAAAEDAGGEPGAWHGPLCKAGFLASLVGRNYSSRIGNLSREATTKRGVN